MPKGARPVGRPPALSRAEVVAAAIDVGLRDLTLQSVADRLDVSVSGLYRYVDHRDHLVELAGDEIASRFVMPTDDAVDAASYLIGIGHGVRNLALEYDGLGDFFGRTGTRSPNWLRTIERFIHTLVGFGHSAPDAVALGTSVANFATASVERQRRAELDAVEGKPLAEQYEEAIPTQFDPADLPLLRQGQYFLAAMQADDYFAWILESFVEGLLANVANAPWRSPDYGSAAGAADDPRT
ncbi:MAG: TetR/AcrR family transcriptional regulator C-terminal domain-containing protein [Actinomycetota bacterium]